VYPINVISRGGIFHADKGNPNRRELGGPLSVEERFREPEVRSRLHFELV
jgi:hypothetical protein